MITFFFEHHHNTISIQVIWLFFWFNQPITKTFTRKFNVVPVKCFIIENVPKPNKYSSGILLNG